MEINHAGSAAELLAAMHLVLLCNGNMPFIHIVDTAVIRMGNMALAHLGDVREEEEETEEKSLIISLRMTI